MEITTLRLIAAWCVLIYANTLKLEENYSRNEYLLMKGIGIVGLAVATFEMIAKTLMA
jgi:hypothetical protein